MGGIEIICEGIPTSHIDALEGVFGRGSLLLPQLSVNQIMLLPLSSRSTNSS